MQDPFQIHRYERVLFHDADGVPCAKKTIGVLIIVTAVIVALLAQRSGIVNFWALLS